VNDAVEARKLHELGAHRHLRVGETLVVEGDESDAVFVVVDGLLQASVASADGDIVIGEMRPGEVIGEVAALAGLRRSATVSAVGEAHVVVIDRATFGAWLAGQPERADEIATEARHRLNRTQLAEMAMQFLGEAAHDLVPEMLAVAEWVDLEAGEVLFREGDQPDAAYFVLSGRLQVSAADGPDTRVLRDVGRWEVLGELAIIDRGARSATVTALRDSTLARIPLEAFERLLVSHPPLLLMVVRRMVSRLTGSTAAGQSATAARSVAIVVADGVRVDDVVGPIVEAVRMQGTCAVLTAAGLDAALGRDGIAQTTLTDVGSLRVSQYLDELEAGHDHLVYVGDSTATGWSRRVLQRADTVVIVAPAKPTPAVAHAVDALLDTCERSRAPKWLALLDPAAQARPTPGASWPSRHRFDEVHHLRAGNGADLARVGRLSLGVGYGLVLGGGGARGFAHLGVMRALQESGVPVDRIGGASMGSIFGAAASLYQDLDEITALCKQQFKRLFDYTIPVVSLLKAKRITANLTHVFAGLGVDDLWVPFHCVSTNLTRSQLHVHRDGELVTALRASIAIPGVLPPVPFGDELLVDGGVLDNVPADVMRADRSIGTVIASDVAPSAGPMVQQNYGMFLSGWQALRHPRTRRRDPMYPGVGSVLIRTMITGSEGRRARMRTDGTVDLYLDLDLPGVGLLEFDRMASIIDRGYAGSQQLVRDWATTRTELPRT